MRSCRPVQALAESSRAVIGAGGNALQWSAASAAAVPAEGLKIEADAGGAGESIADGDTDAGGEAAGDETGADDGSAFTPEEFEALRP